MYKYNFRFNASHSVKNEAPHSHTFELTCYIDEKNTNYVTVEEKIKKYLNKYKGKYLNEILKNTYIEDIAEEIYKDLRKMGIKIRQLEFSDKPIQVYIIKSRRR